MTGYPPPVVIWRKASGQLPQERVKYNNSSLQLLNARKIDSDLYLCSATNLPGTTEKRALVVIVSHPRFTVKPPVSISALFGDTLTLNCSATGDPQPVISWRKQGRQKDRIRVLHLLSYSFGIETTDTLIHNRHNRSSFVNQSRFQTKMGKIYTRFQTKPAQKPYPLGRNIPIWLI